MDLPKCVNGNLDQLLKAQEQAEEQGKEKFPCPVCGGDAVWTRYNNYTRMQCVCHGCGMYLQG